MGKDAGLCFCYFRDVESCSIMNNPPYRTAAPGTQSDCAEDYKDAQTWEDMKEARRRISTFSTVIVSSLRL